MAESPLDPDFEQLLEHLLDERGVDFTGYKRPSLMRLVGRRMQAAGCDTYRSYQEHLEVDPAEFALLFDALLINVTGFFRDSAAWDALRDDVLAPTLAALPDDAPVRAWSAACATGEEAYTLAIVLAEMLGVEAFQRRVKVYATDVDEGALAVARAGRYPRTVLGSLPENLRETYFPGDGDVLAFRSDLRGSIIFGRHDLIQDAPISRVSVLACRNVLMYLNHETQGRVLERFAFALADDGVLLLGKAEMLLTHGELFAPIDLGNRLFRRRRTRGRDWTRAIPRSSPGEQAVLRRVTDAAFTTAPEAQVVLDRNGLLSLVNDAAVRLLGVDQGDLGTLFQDLALSLRPVELRRAVTVARTEQRSVELRDVEGGEAFGRRWFDVQVVPLVEESEAGVLGVQISFLDVTRYHALAAQLAVTHRELETAYEEVQSGNEELETTNEELQSAVEELETTNEELQSTNEELETMNEELQSTNEELQTLNDELRVRTGEVRQVNSFLESILIGLQGGVVVVDRELVVRVWNERAEGMWGLRVHEAQGRHLLNLDIGLPVGALRDTLRAVLQGETTHIRDRVPAVNRFGKPVLCEISCSALRDTTGEVTGAIVVMEEYAAHD